MIITPAEKAAALIRIAKALAEWGELRKMREEMKGVGSALASAKS